MTARGTTVHDILPPAGGHPAVSPGDCPLWALAEGFLGITPTPSQNRAGGVEVSS